MGRRVQNMWKVVLRELNIIRHEPIYPVCIIALPLIVALFFTTMMQQGQPQEMPVGVVDQDNSSTSRSIIRLLDGMQTSQIVKKYPSVSQARRAIQSNEIYAFLHIPKGMTSDLFSKKQPTLGLYYSMTMPTSGALLYKDMLTTATLASANAGKTALQAKGMSDVLIETALQPITIDLHQIGNPWANYNMYLSVMLIPGVTMLFIFLITAYSIGTELKFSRSKQWLALAEKDIIIALTGKLLPQFILFLLVIYSWMYYLYGILGFPYEGGIARLALLGLLTVIASQGLGIFFFTIIPSLRISMSACSLWAVLSFSIAGSAYPITSMDVPLQVFSWLFPLRHYFQIYRITILNAYPLHVAWPHFVALIIFALLPFTILWRLKRVMLTYKYIP